MYNETRDAEQERVLTLISRNERIENVVENKKI